MSGRLYDTALHLLENEHKAILEDRIEDANAASREFMTCYLEFLSCRPAQEYVSILRTLKSANRELRRGLEGAEG